MAAGVFRVLLVGEKASLNGCHLSEPASIIALVFRRFLGTEDERCYAKGDAVSFLVVVWGDTCRYRQGNTIYYLFFLSFGDENGNKRRKYTVRPETKS